MTSSLEAFFLPVQDGRRFCVHHPARATLRGVVLHVHAWAEEMNKSRRMVAMASRAMADTGYAVLQLDLFGCGDSDGDIANACWNGWCADVAAGAAWLQANYPDAPLWLWGQRAGALLAVQAGSALPGCVHHLFWQPSPAGKAVLAQFLRLKAAAGLQQLDAKQTLEQARNDLAAGLPVNVAGYTLRKPLTDGLQAAQLDPPATQGALYWLETTTRDPAVLLPASEPWLHRWRQAGHAVHATAVQGPAFWQTQEIEDAPALVAATLQLLEGARQPERAAA